MKGDLLYNILDFVADRSMDQVDFFEAFLKAGYGASLGRLEHEHRKIARRREKYTYQREEKRRFLKYLSALKQDGLILEHTKGQIKISAVGKKKLKLLNRNKILNASNFQKEKSDRILIITYDLPVKFNKERSKLREILRILDFHKIQQSVWVGKSKIPLNFIRALKEANILKYVEILEVTKKGSLVELA